LPVATSTTATGAAATAATCEGEAVHARPASKAPAAEGTQDFQVMWQSVAAHHGLDPQLSLAHEQQLAELTGGTARRKKGAARHA
jgi:hypothetical protein